MPSGSFQDPDEAVNLVADPDEAVNLVAKH